MQRQDMETTADGHRERTGYVAALLFALALGLRLFYATATHLNPDEAMHVNGALAPTLAATVERAWEHSHPPLLFLLLHFWLKLGSVEWMARLPLIVADIATLALVFSWLRRRWGDASAVLALAFLAASPAAIAAGSEVRQIGLALFFATAALACLDRICDGGSRRWQVAYGLSLGLAISAHFGAAWLLVAHGLYAPLRLQAAAASRATWAGWVIGQLAIFVWSVGLYTSNRAADGFFFHPEYLMPLLYEPARQALVDYVMTHTWAALAFLGGNPVLGWLVVAAYVGGLYVVAGTRGVRRADIAWLLVPLLLGIVGGVTRQMPFGGSRHVAYLLPVVAAAVGIGLGAVLKQRAVPLVACLLALAWATTTRPANHPGILDAVQLERAIAYLDGSTTPGATVIVDRQTYEVLRYALRDRPGTLTLLGENVRAWEHARGTLVVLHDQWILQPRVWWSAIEPLLGRMDIGVGDHAWVMLAGWPRLPQYPYTQPAELVRGFRQFGTFRIFEVERSRTSPSIGS